MATKNKNLKILLDSASAQKKEELDLSGLHFIAENDNSSNNQLSWRSFIGYLEANKHIRKLNLALCNLQSLPSEIGKLKHLVSLILEKNNLLTLPDEICNLDNLKILNCKSNRLASLPIGMNKLRSLELLLLWNNNIKNLPLNFDLFNLQVLDISKNPIESIEENQLLEIEKLHTLNIEETLIDNFFQSWYEKKSLKKLNYSLRNKFTFIPRKRRKEKQILVEIEVDKLWGESVIQWKLNQDVNILAGGNGSGKSTILEIIYGILTTGTIPKRRKKAANRCHITLSNHKKMLVYADDNEYQSLANEFFNRKFKHNETVLELISIDELKQFLPNTYLFSPIDNLFIYSDTFEKMGIFTEVDWLLYEKERELLNYFSFAGKFSNISEDSESVLQFIDKKLKKVTLFHDMIDGLFADTNKKINRKEATISFLFGEKQISKFDLSTGEKLMLILLLMALTQDEKPAIMILDEPEVSLHTDWQESLIDNLRKLNPNLQLIIATHSPFILGGRWASEQYVFQMEKLIVK